MAKGLSHRYTYIPSLLNLPPISLRNYLQGSNGEINIENRLMDMGRGEVQKGGDICIPMAESLCHHLKLSQYC